MKLQIPRLSGIENISDPKEQLFRLLRQASGLPQSRQRKLDVGRCRQRVAEKIEDYSPLRKLEAFRELERDLEKVLRANGW